MFSARQQNFVAQLLLLARAGDRLLDSQVVHDDENRITIDCLLLSKFGLNQALANLFVHLGWMT